MCHKEPLKKLHYKALVCSHGVGRKVCENESQCTESVFEAEQMLSGSNFPLTRCSFSSKANSIANKKGSLSLRSAPETQPNDHPPVTDCVLLIILIKTQLWLPVSVAKVQKQAQGKAWSLLNSLCP